MAQTSQIGAIAVLALVLGIWPFRVLLGEAKPVAPVAVAESQALPGPIDPASSMTPKSQSKSGSVVFLTTPACFPTDHDRKLQPVRPMNSHLFAEVGFHFPDQYTPLSSVSLVHTSIGSLQRLTGAKPSGTA